MIFFQVLQSFYINEMVCKGLEINMPAAEKSRNEITNLCYEVSKEGVSLLAKEVKTGQVVGMAFNKILVRFWLFNLSL